MWINIEQNTPEWYALRSGKVTGSAATKIMAHYPNAFGDPAKTMAVNIACERLTGQNILQVYSNAYMDRGHEMEPYARNEYMEVTGVGVGNGGFFDNGNTGCSPDGIAGDGLIEIKTAAPAVHYKRIKKGTYDTQYRWQLIFNMREADVPWIDFVSYCPEFPKGKRLFIHRVYRKQVTEALSQIDRRLEKFEKLVTRIKQEIA